MVIDHGTFIPLVSSVSGSVGKECCLYHKHMAEKIANKTGKRYEKITPIVIRCTQSFLILKSFPMCIGGSSSVQKSELVDSFAIDYDRSKWLCGEQLQS